MDTKLAVLSTQFLAERFNLTAFIYGLVRDANVAEDIFQEVWIKLSDAIRKGTEIEDPLKWSRGVARNLVLRHWRDQRTRKVVADSELVALVERAFEEQDGNRNVWEDKRRALMTCLEKLPGKSRDFLRLKYEKEFPVAKIAKDFSKTTDSVMKALSRVRRSLGECVEKTLRAAEEGA